MCVLGFFIDVHVYLSLKNVHGSSVRKRQKNPEMLTVDHSVHIKEVSHAVLLIVWLCYHVQ